MNFTKDSQLVKNYVLLIENNKMELEDVPQLFNLKDVVQDVLNDKANNKTNNNNN